MEVELAINKQKEIISGSTSKIFSYVPMRLIKADSYFKIIRCRAKENNYWLCKFCIYWRNCPFKRVLTHDKVKRGKIRRKRKLTCEKLGVGKL